MMKLLVIWAEDRTRSSDFAKLERESFLANLIAQECSGCLATQRIDQCVYWLPSEIKAFGGDFCILRCGG